jgi:cyclophilin family peptidyl-prolyl cis-trans isomerase
VILDTSKGQIEIGTLPAEAPKSVERFIELAKRGFYREQRFHWVQSNLIQAGDVQTRDMTLVSKWGSGGSGPKFALRPLGVAETSKRPFNRGTVALAYFTGSKPETADCQFFILKVNSPEFTGKYAPIGLVTRGMNVVDKVEKGDTIKSVTVK